MKASIVKDLGGIAYAKGRPLTAGELRALPDGSVVWAHVLEYDGHAPGGRVLKSNGPASIARSKAGSEWIIGSAEFWIDSNVSAKTTCIDNYAEGCIRLYRAAQNKDQDAK